MLLHFYCVGGGHMPHRQMRAACAHIFVSSDSVAGKSVLNIYDS